LGSSYRVRDTRARELAAELPLLSVSQTRGVVPRRELTGGDHGRATDLANYKVCLPGDLVINRMSAYNGALGIARQQGLVSPDYLVLEPRGIPDFRFHAYWLRSAEGQARIRSLLRGIGSAEVNQVRTPRVNESDLRTLELSTPGPDDQVGIADYLDRETAQIDTLIAKQEHLILLLRERRAGIEVAAVAGHPMVALRRLVVAERPLTYGIVQAGENVDDGVRYVGPSDMNGHLGVRDPSALRRTASAIAAQYARSSVVSGDLIVSIGPAFGKTMRVPDELTGVNLTQDTARVACDARIVDPEFALRVLRSSVASDFWEAEIAGATFRRLNLNTLARTPIPLPPLDEQRRIVAYLDEQTAKIDTLIAKAQRFIELAKERRSALISAAVTGQLDVTA
jgi:type I restriction enzyme S subunit